jgi:hypothetical protein
MVKFWQLWIKIHNQKPRTLKIFPQVSRLLQKFYYTLLIFKVELKQGKQGGRIQDLDVPRKVQTKSKEAQIETCDYKLDWLRSNGF